MPRPRASRDGGGRHPVDHPDRGGAAHRHSAGLRSRTFPTACISTGRSVRRLRSVLAALPRPPRRAGRARPAGAVREWGQQLGVVRDVEVQADVAAAAMDDLGIDDAAMRARLVDAEREEYARAHARLRELFDGPRSVARMAALEQFAADPSTTAEADAAAERLTRGRPARGAAGAQSGEAQRRIDRVAARRAQGRPAPALRRRGAARGGPGGRSATTSRSSPRPAKASTTRSATTATS